MKCPKCGMPMLIISRVETGNYTIFKRKYRKCKYKATSYEFFKDDLPPGYTEPGTRILIGDSLKKMVPAIYLKTSSNCLYPYIALDEYGELQGKLIVQIAWGVKEL